MVKVSHFPPPDYTTSNGFTRKELTAAPDAGGLSFLFKIKNTES